jgi:hypothetical protein
MRGLGIAEFHSRNNPFNSGNKFQPGQVRTVNEHKK